MPFTPTEIYMWLPDVVAVVVRDAPPTRTFITPHEEDESASLYDTWLADKLDPRDDVLKPAMVLGPNKEYYRFDAVLSTEFLDRVEALDVSNWTFTGFGGTITQVSHRCEPYMDAYTDASGRILQCVMEHTLLLHLSTNLSEASYTIANASADIPSTGFTFNDQVTRAGGIRVNQIGYRPSDFYKNAILAQRLPKGANGGVIDFADYGFVGTNEFNVLDASKNVVHTGNIVERVEPGTTEPGWTSHYIADYSTPLAITDISNASPAIVTCPSHGLTTGTRVMFRGMPTAFYQLEAGYAVAGGYSAVAFEITNTGANTFTIAVNTSAWGAYVEGGFSTADGGYDSLCYPAILSNLAGTYTYDMDFSAYAPADASTSYYIQIPGYGISDPFLLHEAAHAIAFGKVHEGLYSQRRGIAVSSGPDFSHGANFRDDGVTHFRNYRTNMTSASTTEGGSNLMSNLLVSSYSGYAPAITSDRVTLVDSGWGHQDAGDSDTHLADHMELFYRLMTMLLDAPQASRITPFEVPLSSAAIGARYNGTDDWPPIMHEIAWFMDFWLSLQEADGSVMSGLALGTFGSQVATNEPSHLYHGNNSQNFVDRELTGPGFTVHGAIMSPDHVANYWAAAGFALFSLLCDDYGDTTLADTYKQAAIDAWDWAESIVDSHAGDKVDRDAHYETYLDFKNMPCRTTEGYSGKYRILSVDTGANTATIDSLRSDGIGFDDGTKVGVHAGTGALPGGLTTGDDYYINVSTAGAVSTVSFHTSAADGISGANKIDLTSGYSAGPVIFKTMTDAEYESNMDQLNTQALVMRPYAAGALLRCVGWAGGSEYAAFFTAGSPNPSESSVYHYMRAAQAGGVFPGTGPGTGPADAADYAFGSEDSGGVRAEPGWQWNSVANYADFNVEPNIPSFPAGQETAVSTARSSSAYDSSHQWRLLKDTIEEGNTTDRDRILKNILAHVSFVQGTNLPGKCLVQGAGVRHQSILVQEDAAIQGQFPPYGVVGYTWFQWPISGITPNNADQFGVGGTLNWVCHNVTAATAADAYKLIEPWKFSQSHWETQINNQGLIYQSEFSIGTTQISQMAVTLAAHIYDENTIYTLGEAEITYNSAGLRFRWHT